MSPPDERNPISQGWYVLLFCAALVGTLAHYEFGYSSADIAGHAWGSDDAYITYRYADNFVQGNGLVFNEGERVEGYTNCLYTLLCSALLLISSQHIYGLSVAANVVCYACTLLLFYRYAARTMPARAALAASAVVSLCPLMWVWPATGLETSSVVLVQFALFIVAEESSQRPDTKLPLAFCLLAGVSVFLRADGFVFPVFCALLFALRGKKNALTTSMIAIAGFTILNIVVRYAYYGLPWPNTFYAKVSGPPAVRSLSALRQLAALSVRECFFLYLLPLALGWRPFVRSLRRQKFGDLSLVPSISFVSCGLLAYWVYIGGDYFHERFLVVLILLSMFQLFQTLAIAPREWIQPVLIVGLVLCQFLPFEFDGRFRYHPEKYDQWVELGQFLGNRPRGTLAIGAAGKVPFLSQWKAIDMLGLNDAHIGQSPARSDNSFAVGHNKFDADYVLGLSPDLIATWANQNGDLWWGLAKHKYLASGYRLKYVVNSTPDSKVDNILDVSAMTEAQISALFSAGYRYFVLSKSR